MAVDASTVRQTYTIALQDAANDVLNLVSKLNELNTFYLGAGLSGTFTDGEVQAYNATKHLTAVDIGTYTTNLGTITTAITTAIQQNMAKCKGATPT